MSTLPLGGVYEARSISFETYHDACARLEDRIFGGNWLYAFGPATKPPPPLGETFQWGLYRGEELIGWHHAHARDGRTVYMADTGILPEHQGHGLYTRLLPLVLETYREAGYTLVHSHHRATNNRVVVPKLRVGFSIQGLNLYEGGLNVALTLSLDETYRESMHVRSGLKQASGEAARRLGLSLMAGREGTEAAIPSVSLPLPEEAGKGQDLGGGYSLHRVPYETYLGVYHQLAGAAYTSVSFDWQAPTPFPAPEVPRYTWLVAHAGEVVGWHFSRRWDARTAYMVNTAFLPAHRRQGLYTRLLPLVLGTLETQGYRLVRSHHHATNNAVILPKLRAGFCLQGLEVDDHGVMAVLIRAFDPVYQDYMDLRSGLTRPKGEAARRIGLHLSEDEA
ncbi:GNAT family N-acetyltransferase [Deinococcus hopiensis]|uniref:Sortase and related acyltransferases n=1 Tax=Deinococcus hopiensis KR-140 TaxID=695939 RepID=A0A1W1V7C0_9DEIO|nr:GNAT family N-acetyltransferase [Deinococcus hopiensis]SMB89258.1 Sortase and related acyltransferases [Deinococcus hopiensis KR-140]